MSLLELFVNVDDFCQRFLPVWEKKLISDGSKKRRRTGQLSISKIMTILIYFHQSRYWNFKAYYTEHVCQRLSGEFPNLVTYERFVILMPSALGPLSAYLKSLYGCCNGISFVDSTALEVCDPHRIHNHKVFEGIAERGKGPMGWFYGLSVVDQLNNISQIERMRYHKPDSCLQKRHRPFNRLLPTVQNRLCILFPLVCLLVHC